MSRPIWVKTVWEICLSDFKKTESRKIGRNNRSYFFRNPLITSQYEQFPGSGFNRISFYHLNKTFSKQAQSIS